MSPTDWELSVPFVIGEREQWGLAVSKRSKGWTPVIAAIKTLIMGIFISSQEPTELSRKQKMFRHQRTEVRRNSSHDVQSQTDEYKGRIFPIDSFQRFRRSLGMKRQTDTSVDALTIWKQSVRPVSQHQLKQTKTIQKTKKTKKHTGSK